MKKLLMALLLIMIVGAVVSANSAYDAMICAIDHWLESNPPAHFENALQEEIFAWRLQIERLSYRNEESFERIIELREELGDKEFRYNNIRYNSHSTRELLLKHYPSHDYGDIIGFFAEQYDWYKTTITEANHQMYWLLSFYDFVNYIGWRGNVAEQLVEQHPDLVDDMIKQLLALTQNQRVDKWRDIYSDQTIIYIGGGTRVDNGLQTLNSFLSSYASLIDENQKQYILNWLLPTYADHDSAVQIYAMLVD